MKFKTNLLPILIVICVFFLILVFCGLQFLFTIKNIPDNSISSKINELKNIALPVNLNTVNISSTNSLKSIKNDLCGNLIETNDYKFHILCIPASDASKEAVKVGNISVFENKILVLSQNGYIHLLDSEKNSYLWSLKLNLPKLDINPRFSAGAKGILWVEKHTLIVYYISKKSNCSRPAMAEFTNFNMDRYKRPNEKLILNSSKSIFFGKCLGIKDNPDFNGTGGAMLKTSDTSFLVTVGAPEGLSLSIRKLAQNPKSYLGKILEFKKGESSWLNRIGSIYTSGHRNPQGLTMFSNGILISAEHGPKGGDEINLIKKGKNYGWGKYSFGRTYDVDPVSKNSSYLNPQDSTAFQSPIYYFSPSIGICGIHAMNKKFYERWRNTVLVASLRNMSLHILKLSKDFKQVLSDEIIELKQRLRSVTTIGNKIYIFSEYGDLYILDPEAPVESVKKAI